VSEAVVCSLVRSPPARAAAKAAPASLVVWRSMCFSEWGPANQHTDYQMPPLPPTNAGKPTRFTGFALIGASK